MTNYRRLFVPGAAWFFTVNLQERHNNHLLVENLDLLRAAFTYVKERKPFRIDAVVIMPDHLHCIWTLPSEDGDYPIRWNMLKGYFSHAIPQGEKISTSRRQRRERGLWQRRYWAHLLTDQNDFNCHVDYVHWNPVKHGRVKQVVDWPHSSFHRYVKEGVYPADWAHSGDFDVSVDAGK